MPASTAYSNHELLAHRGDLTIFGQLFLPGNYVAGTKLPTIACAHGFGANYLHAVPYAWELAAHGYAVYCFDFCGGGYASRSDGNPITMSLDTERDDVLAVMRMLSQRPEVDSNHLFLMGEGQGGFAATMAAHDAPQLVRALVLLYPAFHLHDEARHAFPTKKNIPVSYRQLGMRVGRCYGEVAWDTNPYTQMRDYPGQVLIVHGDEDATCFVEYSERAVEVFPHARLEVIHGGKHVFRDKALEKSIATVRDFLDEQVRTLGEAGVGDEAVKAEGTSVGAPATSADARSSVASRPSVASCPPVTSRPSVTTPTSESAEALVGASTGAKTPGTTQAATHGAAQTATHGTAQATAHGAAQAAAHGTAQAAAHATTPQPDVRELPQHESPSEELDSEDDDADVQIHGAHVAPRSAYGNRAQSARGRYSVHKTRRSGTTGKHFRS